MKRKCDKHLLKHHISADWKGLTYPQKKLKKTNPPFTQRVCYRSDFRASTLIDYQERKRYRVFLVKDVQQYFNVDINRLYKLI